MGLVKRHCGSRNRSNIPPHQSLHLILGHLPNAQQLVVQLLEMPPVPVAPDRRLDELVHKRVWIRVLLAKFLPSLRQHIVNRHDLLLPPVRAGSLLAFRQERLLSGGRVLDVDGAVACLVRVAQHPGHGLADGGQRGGAEDAVAAVVERDGLSLDVHDEADHDGPVEEGADADDGVRHGIGVLLERVLDDDFGLEGRQGGRFGVNGVGAEFGRNEALDADCASSFHEEELLVDDGGAEGRYDGVLAFEGASQRVERVVVDGLDADGGGEGVGAGLAGEHGDLEPCVEEGIEDGRPKITGSL